LLSSASNLFITSSRFRACEIFYSTDNIAELISLSSCIVDLKYVLMCLNADNNDLSQDAELTQIVSAICKIFSRVEKAS